MLAFACQTCTCKFAKASTYRAARTRETKSSFSIGAVGCALTWQSVVAHARAPPRPSSASDGVALRDRRPTAGPQFRAFVVIVAVAEAEAGETLLCTHSQRACDRWRCSPTSFTVSTREANACYFSLRSTIHVLQQDTLLFLLGLSDSRHRIGGGTVGHIGPAGSGAWRR